MSIVGTAGHVDHGKSELIYALTGVRTAHLPEERTRRMTIDLGFASLRHPLGHNVSFVDVPGHEDLIRNMVSGATAFDVVLWVVSGVEGLKPQSVEHLNILTLLDRPILIPVITYAAVATPEELASTLLQVETALQRSSICRTQVFVVDSVTGTGLKSLRNKILELVITPTVIAYSDPILNVDRSFIRKGLGWVITGTLSHGNLSEGDEVAVSTLGTLCRIKSIHNHHSRVVGIAAGNRVGLQLAGVEAKEIRRGAVVLAPKHSYFASVMNARMRWVDGVKFRWKHGLQLLLHTGTQETACRTWASATSKSPDFLQLELPNTIPCYPGQRFILRSTNPRITVAGGEILDIVPDRQRFITSPEQRLYQDIGSERPWLAEYLKRVTRGAIEVRAAAHRWMIPEVEILRLAALDTQVRMSLPCDEPTSTTWMWSAEVQEKLAQLIEAELVALAKTSNLISYRALSKRLGLSESFLRTLLAQQEAFDLTPHGVFIDLGLSGIRLRFHGRIFTRRQAAVARILIERLSRAGMRPPTIRQMCIEEKWNAPFVDEIISKLCSDGMLVRISSRLVVVPEVAEQLKETLDRHGLTTFRVSDFGAALGLSRKFSVPYLEFLAEGNFVRRDGDTHYRI